MDDTSTTVSSGGLLKRYYRPPFIGVIAFLAVLLAVPLAHSLGVVVRDMLGAQTGPYVFMGMGAVAAFMLVVGTRNNDEVRGTVLGFAAGILIWVGWASYSFKFNEVSLSLPMVQLPDGGRRPMNLLFIQASLGICLATLLFFVFNKDSKCNAFRWMQRALHMNLGDADSARGRNFCRITFLETLYVTWFCYTGSLFLGDTRYLGYHHPVTYAIAVLLTAWGLFLLWRLVKFTRAMAAIRYAIPTKAIFWIPFGELGPRYGLYEEVWLKPAQYSSAMWIVLGICIVLFIGAGLLPQRRQAE